jgi:hypothetical protein
MKRPFIASLLAMALLAPLGSGQVGAQQAGKDQAGKDQAAVVTTTAPTYTVATLRRDFKDSFPIPVGEKLEYEIKLSRFPIYASLGVLTFENLGAVTSRQDSGGAAGDQQKPTAPLIEGLNTAVSKGALIGLFGVDVRDRFETLVDMRDFSARINLKELKEGKKHIIESSLFDRAEQQVKYLITDLTKPGAPPRAKPLSREDGMLSLLSAIYFIRLQKLKEGQMLTFPVSADEENYQVKTVRLEPKLFGPGRFFKLQGEMTMWVSDDNKRTPLRLVAKTAKGTVTAKLLNFKNKCNIIDQEDEVKQKND